MIPKGKLYIKVNDAEQWEVPQIYEFKLKVTSANKNNLPILSLYTLDVVYNCLEYDEIDLKEGDPTDDEILKAEES